MKAIQANPKTIREVFSDSYIIPEFQRPYSWEEEECSKLFEDLTDAFQEGDNNYYLGSIILYKEEPSKNLNVIDGQQRLTTIMLLIKALFESAGTFKALAPCLKIKDPRTDELTNELRIQTKVLENDFNEMKEIILEGKDDGKTKIKKNYKFLKDKLKDFRINIDSDTLDAFITWFLDHVVLLPIQCEALDDALIAFNTVNNRGMPLGDADIFKAYLFRSATTDKQSQKDLIKRWNDLNENGEIDELFRRLMHIKRSQKGDTTREIGLRKYFEAEKEKSLFDDWKNAVKTLEKIKYFDEWDFSSDRIINLLAILDCWKPNDYIWYPVIIFWYKYAEENDNEEWTLSPEKEEEFEKLLFATIKFFYVNAIAYRSVNAVKDTTYKVYCAINNEEDYIHFYNEKYGEAFDVFEKRIKSYEYSKFKGALVALLAVLNKNQNQAELSDLDNWELEHILPQKGGYNNYNGWTEEQYSEKLNTLGNFVMLEKKLNIRASNEFFNKKKKEYEKSVIEEAKDLTKINDWTYSDWEKRHAIKEKEILDFFKEI